MHTDFPQFQETRCIPDLKRIKNYARIKLIYLVLYWYSLLIKVKNVAAKSLTCELRLTHNQIFLVSMTTSYAAVGLFLCIQGNKCTYLVSGNKKGKG